jgi:hypothetical protein
VIVANEVVEVARVLETLLVDEVVRIVVTTVVEAAAVVEAALVSRRHT